MLDNPVEDFKARWAEADANGLEGHRVEYALEPLVDELLIMRYKLSQILLGHSKEMFGDCVEDGEPYPCPTVRIARAHLQFTPDPSDKETP